jgi:hypothetical protein
LLSLASGVGESVAAGPGLDDVPAEGESVEDGSHYLDLLVLQVLVALGAVSWTAVHDELFSA